MSYDGIALRACLGLLQARAAGARVQRAVQPSPLSLALSLYTREGAVWLVCSAEAPAACLYLARSLPHPPMEATPFCTLLRKHLLGARLAGVSQAGWDRIAVLGFAGRNELGDEVSCDLIAEFMGKHSNLICVRPDGRILDAVKRVGRSRSRVRQVLPGHSYVAPPGQGKLAPDEVTGNDLAEAVVSRSAEHDLPPDPGDLRAGELVGAVAGIDAARASAVIAAARGDGGPAAVTWEAIAGHLRLAAADASSGSASADECACAEQAFSAYILSARQGGGRRIAGQAREEAEPGSGRQTRDEIASALAAEAARARRRVDELRGRLDSIPDPEECLRQGNALLTALGELRKRQEAARRDGLKEIAVELPSEPAGPTAGGTAVDRQAVPVTIRLKTDEDPAATAQRYFEQYASGRKAREAVGGLLAGARQRFEYLEQLAFQAEDEPGIAPDALREIVEEARRAGVELQSPAPPKRAETARARPGTGKPMGFTSPGGLEVLVGRNNRENDRLLRLGAPDDLWFHARGVPGAHVLLRKAGRASVAEEDVLFAAGIAAGHSRAAASGTAAVDMVPLRQVRREKGAAPGFVRYSGETTISVIPRRPAPEDAPPRA